MLWLVDHVDRSSNWCSNWCSMLWWCSSNWLLHVVGRHMSMAANLGDGRSWSVWMLLVLLVVRVVVAGLSESWVGSGYVVAVLVALVVSVRWYLSVGNAVVVHGVDLAVGSYSVVAIPRVVSWSSADVAVR